MVIADVSSFGPRPLQAARTRIPAPTLVGRAAEFAWLQDRLAATRRAEGNVAFVTGEAGVGKSRICRELIAANPDAHHLHGAGSHFLPDTPFGPFADALRGRLRDLTPIQVRDLLGPMLPEAARLLPELAVPGDEPSLSPTTAFADARRRLLEACLRIVHRLAERRPLLLAIEDLQWADRGTLELVRYLAWGIRGRPILLLCTYRHEDAPAGSPLADLTLEVLRERLGERLELRPFDARATGELVRAFFTLDRPIPRELAAAVHGCAAGNPFFTEEVVKALVEAGSLIGEDGAIRRQAFADLAPPAAARDLMSAGLDRLAAAERSLLQVLAAAGRACDLPVLARAAGLPQAGTVRAAGDAFRHGFLIAAATGEYHLRHELVRRALLAELLPEEQRDLHARLAGAILEVHAAALDGWRAELAQQFALAGRADEAAPYAWASAQHAASLHAHQEALPFLRICLTAGPPAPIRSAVLELLGDTHAHLGSPTDAAGAYTTLLAEARAAGDRACAGRILRKLAELAHDQGESRLALERCAEAVRLLESAAETAEFARASTSLSRFESAAGDWAAAVRAAERALAAAEACDDAGAFCAAADWLAFHLAYTGQVERAERTALRSLERAQASGDPRARQQACQTLGTIYGDVLADYPRARRYYLCSLRLARRCGDLPAEIKALHNLGAWVSKPLGRWRRAETLLTQARTLAAGAGHHRAAVYALQHLAELAWLQGNLPLVRAHAAALDLEAPLHGDLMVRCRFAAKIQAPLLNWDGHPQEARDHLQALWHEAEGAGFAGGLVVLAPPLADTLLHLDQIEPATTVLDHAQTLWPAVGDRAETAEGMRILARIAAKRGRRPHALDLLAEAEADMGALRRPFDVARLRRERAVILAGHDPEAARVLFRQALETLAGLGAAAEADLTRRLARQHGHEIRLPRNTAARRLPGGLSRRETEVAMLVASGASNRVIAEQLVLGERTVETHVSNILTKLGFASRAQIAAWIATNAASSDGDSRTPIHLLPHAGKSA